MGMYNYTERRIIMQKVKVIVGDDVVIIQVPLSDYYDIKMALKHHANQCTLDLLKKLEEGEK